MNVYDLKWGIVGVGNVANSVAQCIHCLPNTSIHAVCSKSQSNADNFSSTFDIPKVYTSYDELLKDSDIDIIYIATPHTLHYEHCIKAIRAKKHVLCEKPFTLNPQQAREIFKLAKENEVFCMEAMWTKCHPLILKVFEQIKTGAIGTIRMISASLGHHITANEDHRLFNPELGGGVLLDLGIYPLSLIHKVMGKPENIQSQITKGKTGVDEQAGIILQYQNGAIASISCSFNTQMNNELTFMGTKGKIKVHAPLYCPHKYTLTPHSPMDMNIRHKPNHLPWFKKFRVISLPLHTLRHTLFKPVFDKSKSCFEPYEGNGYQFEVIETMNCIKEGKIQSDLNPYSETVEVLEIIDHIRRDQQLYREKGIAKSEPV